MWIDFLPMIFFTFYGASLYRWRGHASRYKKYFPRPYNQLVFAYGLVLPLFNEGWPWELGLWLQSYTSTGWLAPILASLIFMLTWSLTWAAVLTGHGKWFDIGTSDVAAKPERLEPVVLWLYRRLLSVTKWPYREAIYDYTGMTVKGAAMMAPISIVTLNPAYLVAGAGVALCYFISHRIGRGTDGGEWLTGGWLYFSVGLLSTFTA